MMRLTRRSSRAVLGALGSLALLMGLIAFCGPIPAARAATITLPAGGDLQAALNQAQPGDTIVLQAGASYVGPFSLPGDKPGAAYVTIQSSALAQLPAGRRVGLEDERLMPKIVTPGSAQPAIYTEDGAHHFRFEGVEFRPQSPGTVVLYTLVRLGSGEQTAAQVPHHLAFDRCIVRNWEGDDLKRGIELNSAQTEIVNSYIDEFHVVGQEAQAIGGWNGPGPFTIVNNYIEGAGENMMFGGATSSIAGLVPSDIEIRRNHFFKPLSWWTEHPSYAGRHWTVKNLFELKNAQRVIVDGNLFENNWADAQSGTAILFTPRGEDGAAPWARVADVQFTNNIVRNVTGGINILGRDGGATEGTSHLTIRNNLFEGVDDRFLVAGGAEDIVLDHNTVLNDGSVAVLYDGGEPHLRFVFNNNVVKNNEYGFFGDVTGTGTVALERFAPGYDFRRNCIVGGDPAAYPPDNLFPPTLEAVGFTDLAGKDYRLAAASPCSARATDAKDIGVDVDALNAAMAGTGPTPTPTPTATPPPTATPTPTPTATATAPSSGGFRAKVNFQTETAALPVGYLKDFGQAYAPRGNGHTYGWTADNTANARDRDDPRAGGDNRYDTLIHLQRAGTYTWEITVPNGAYRVRVVAGDPTYIDSVYKIAVEGVLAVDGAPTAAARWREGTVTVRVKDGKLTVGNAPGARNNKICFIEIEGAGG